MVKRLGNTGLVIIEIDGFIISSYTDPAENSTDCEFGQKQIKTYGKDIGFLFVDVSTFVRVGIVPDGGQSEALEVIFPAWWLKNTTTIRTYLFGSSILK